MNKRLTRNVEYNSPVALLEWAEKALKESLLGLDEQGVLMQIAEAKILMGGLRGDISEAWVKAGNYTMAEIPDMYL